MSWVTIRDAETGKCLHDTRTLENESLLPHSPFDGEILKISKEIEMPSLPAVKEFTRDEIELIKSTIAKGATNDELKLFLYRCENLGLDPLKPGQIYFIKYGSGPGTIVVGLEGFRSKASRTGKHTGTQRGVLRNNSGTCVGAWAEVSRSDWTKPAREEVSLAEYNTGKGNWAKMPETMIKKVAEAAALRMAFPDDLGGIYVNEEMDQAESQTRAVESTPAMPSSEVKIEAERDTDDPGEYVVAFGKKYKGQKIKDIDPGELGSFIEWCDDQATKKNQPLSSDARMLKVQFGRYIDQLVQSVPLEGQPSFDDMPSAKDIPWPENN